MAVIIGVDPHRVTHTVVAIDRTEPELGRAKVRATRKQVPQVLSWAEPLGSRTWAIESARRGPPPDDDGTRRPRRE